MRLIAATLPWGLSPQRLHRLAPSATSRRIAANASLRVIGTGLNFVALVLLARVLGADGYGSYVYWMALSGMIATLAAFGMPSLVGREVAAGRGRGDAGAIHGVLRVAGTTVAITSVVILVAAFVIAAVNYPAAEHRLVALLAAPPVIVFASAALANLAGIASATQLGFEQVLRSILPASVLQPLLMGVFAAGAWLAASGGGVGTSRMLGLQLLATAVVLIAAIVLLSVSIPGPERRRIAATPPQLATRAWLVAGFFFMANQLLINASTQVDILMLRWLAGSAEVGFYHVAARLISVATFWYGVMTGVIAPTVARHWAAGDRAGVQRVIVENYLPSFFITAAALVGIVALGRPLLAFFGGEFTAGYPALLVLSVAWVVCVGCGPVVPVVYAAGGERLVTITMAAAMALNVLLGVFLIPSFGLVGAAFAFWSLGVVPPLALTIYCATRLGVRCDVFGVALGPLQGLLSRSVGSS